MPINPIDSAIDALVAHFQSTIQVSFNGSTSPIRCFRGWRENNAPHDYDEGPILTVTVFSEDRVEHAPMSLEETQPQLWAVADLTIKAQLDLWTPYRATRDEVAQLIRTNLHDDIPYRTGLHLTHADYYSRDITVHGDEVRDPRGVTMPQTGVWRRTWTLTITTPEVVEQLTPQQLEWVVRQLDEQGNVVEEDTFT